MMNRRPKLEWLAGGGEMAELIATLDWSRTPLGPLESWPQSLRTTVSLCLASNFPINIIWGDDHCQIYNDGYRVVCGAVHPRALSEDYRVTWASAWPAIGEPFERALAGETTYLENQRMFLERNGYPEETFFTFSLSPIRDEKGKVVGLFHPVTETTATMLAERRTRALRDIVDRAGRALVFDEACELLLATLRQYELDLPFAVLYTVSEDGHEARLRGMYGAAPGHAISREVVSLSGGDPSDGWPLVEATGSERVHRVTDVRARFGKLIAGPYVEPIANAFALPLRVAGVARPLGFLVVGASPRLPLDEKYAVFIEMLGAAASAALGNARAYQIERQRAEALSEIDRAKTTFFSNVSHEFRTPLTLLLGPIEDLLHGRRDELSGAALAELELVHRNALRLLKLVNALLDFSRIEAGPVERTLEPTDLAALTRDLASAFRSAIERAGMNLVVDLEPLDTPVLVDRDMWEKIVLNLLSNAFKFTKAGEIRVSLRRIGQCAELSVTDSGTGIPPEERDRVFQRFHRVQGAAGRTHEGSGIGLALVHELAKLHGGSVRVQSVYGEGSTFSVRIPIGEQMPASTAPPRDAAVPSEQGVRAFVEEATRWLPDARPSATSNGAPVGARTRSRILLADDNADMRSYVERLLRHRYDVTAVANGVEALEAAKKVRPDLVLSDVMMPQMDGAELVKRLREDDALRTIPIILLSARAGEEATASGLEVGADDYLTKPFATKELLARVGTQLKMSVLRRRTAEQEALLGGRDEFLAIASHELRTPLTSLRMQVQMAECAMQENGNALPSERARRMLQVLSNGVDRLAGVVDDLLDVARIRSGQLDLAVSSVDLVALVRGTLERLSGDLARAGCTTHFSAPPRVMGRWDGRRLEQVLTKLLANVIKYAPCAPLHVTLEDDGDDARLLVRDFGAGIPEAQRDGIFDRFDRAGLSRNAGGLGLGLFISRQLVRAHGGSIAVDGPPGGGARFVVRLPKNGPGARAVRRRDIAESVQ